MPDTPKPSRATKNTMDPMPKSRSRKVTSPKSLGDQVARPTERADDGPGYFRIRMHIADGELSVAGIKFVGGPIRQDAVVSSGLTYDAKIGRRRVAFGDVPDTIEWRSFPDPAGKGEMAGHHVVEQTRYDFTVRVPAAKITESDLENLRVSLYEWRGGGPGEHISIGALSKQPKTVVRRLAVLPRMESSKIPVAVRKEVKSAFKEAGNAGNA